MIIKRSLKSKMPTLKRCKVEDPGFEDDENPGEKRKKRNGFNYNYNPLDLLSDVAAGRIPVNGFGFGDDGDEEEEFSSVSYCSGEDESKRRRREGWRVKNRNAEAFRPPLVKTARGRFQVLPSRFNDSVLDPWKKETTKTIAESTLFRKEKFNSENLKFDNRITKNQREEDHFPNSLYCTGKKKKNKRDEEEEEEEMGNMRFKSFDIRKFTSSGSSLTSLQEPLIDVEKSPPLREDLQVAGEDSKFGDELQVTGAVAKVIRVSATGTKKKVGEGYVIRRFR